VKYQFKSSRLASLSIYPWLVLGLLWFCGFFNYADRQAVFSVFPLLEREFDVSKEQLGYLGSAFMIVYACASPFSGYTVDLLPRRLLVTVGLSIWSLVCAVTGLARSFPQLLCFRAAEGLGESFYFPASMSLLADYHGPRTRSRALAIHQTSVYLGTAGGAVLGGFLGELYGWRAPFWALGLAGIAYAALVGCALVEPPRATNPDGSRSELDESVGQAFHPEASADAATDRPGFQQLIAKLVRFLTNPAAALLLFVFLGANFVAGTFLAWLPSYIFERFNMRLGQSSLTSTLWPLASLPGAVWGGIAADRARQRSAGGRIKVQCVGLFLAVPFVLLAGWATSIPFLIIGLVGAGICKGIYDSNIFAALFDVIPAADRGTASGLMNTVGWGGAALAPTVVGISAQRFGLGATIACTAAVYLLAGVLAALAVRLVNARAAQLG
jgi:MFS family permease